MATPSITWRLNWFLGVIVWHTHTKRPEKENRDKQLISVSSQSDEPRAFCAKQPRISTFRGEWNENPWPSDQKHFNQKFLTFVGNKNQLLWSLFPRVQIWVYFLGQWNPTCGPKWVIREVSFFSRSAYNRNRFSGFKNHLTWAYSVTVWNRSFVLSEIGKPWKFDDIKQVRPVQYNQFKAKERTSERQVEVTNHLVYKKNISHLCIIPVV